MKLLWISIIAFLASQSHADVFETEPSDQVVPLQSTADVTFKCKANVDEPVYSWRKNNKPLDTSSGSRAQSYRGTLTISNPQPEDEGKYQCVVTSDKGIVVSNYGSLTFAYIDPFPQITQSLTTTTGQGINLTCPHTAYAPRNQIVIYWEKDAEYPALFNPRNNDPDHYVSQVDGSLYFANPKTSDSGKYSCVIKGNWEENGAIPKQTSSPIQLQVTDAYSSQPATFLATPAKVINAKKGGMMIIQCFASGNPTPSITWSKQDSVLPESHKISNSGQLVLANITEDMAGTYICTASNDGVTGRTIQAMSQLQLEYEPQWSRGISSSEVPRSSTFKASCSASGSPQPSYLWLKDGEELYNSDRINIASTSSGSELTLTSTNVTDEGMYQCVAYNPLGYIFSSAHLKIASQPPKFNTEMSDITKAAEDSYFTIICDVTAAPEPTFSWMKDYQPLNATGGKYRLVDTGLLVSYVRETDEGEYTCTATNSLGEVNGVTFLKVYKPTVVSSHESDGTLLAGDATELICTENHDPQLSVSWTWTQNNKSISNIDMHYEMSGGVLRLLDVTSNQIGQYECCASTEVSTDCTNFFVNVLAPPDAPTNVLIMYSSSDTQMVTWDAPDSNGSPIGSYLVEKIGEYDIDWSYACSSNVTSCSVENLLPHNRYSYRVYAYNSMGKSKPSSASKQDITLTGAPVFAPTGLSGGGGDPGQLVVTWEQFPEQYYGAAEVSYVISMRKEDPGDPVNLPVDLDGTPAPPSDKPWFTKVELDSKATQTIFQVNKSEIFVPYEVTIKAQNADGEGPTSDQTVVHTAEIPPDVSPTGFYKKQAKAYSAEIAWNYLPNTNGYTQGYKVAVCDLINNDPCTNPNGWMNLTTVDEKPNIMIENLRENHNYKLKAAGFNRAGLGPWSDFSFSFVTAGPPPTNAPMNIKMKVIDQDVSAQWDEVQPAPLESKIIGYVVQYWLANETSAQAKDHHTSLPQVDFTLPAKADYQLWIRAYNEGGNGRPSTTYAISSQKSTSSKYGGGASSVTISASLLLLCVWSIARNWLN